MRDTGLRIGVQRDLRDGFVHLFQAQDKPAVQVLGEFTRAYVDGHQMLLADAAPTSSGQKSKGR